MNAVDLTGWDTRLHHLSGGLDLRADADRQYLAERLLGAGIDIDTLTALASWLGQPTRSTHRHNAARRVADAWAAELARRAQVAADRAAARDPFARVPAVVDDAW